MGHGVRPLVPLYITFQYRIANTKAEASRFKYQEIYADVNNKNIFLEANYQRGVEMQRVIEKYYQGILNQLRSEVDDINDLFSHPGEKGRGNEDADAKLNMYQ